jgi:hypothetical protein
MMCENLKIMHKVDLETAKKIKNFSKRLKEYYQVEWFMNQTASWNSIYKPIFTETLTKRGYAFSFNMVPDYQLLSKEYESHLNSKKVSPKSKFLGSQPTFGALET